MAKLSFHPAPLTDPLYYLSNARLLIRWSLEHHGDLLLSDEIRLLTGFLELPTHAQALMIRMVMRKGELFRSDSLSYDEIPDTDTALAHLAGNNLIISNPAITLDNLCHLIRKPELLNVARSQLVAPSIRASLSKQALTNLLSADVDENLIQPLSQWWPAAPFALIQLSCMPLFDRLRLMFFGNLYQDWSEFVLTGLGLQQYESVALTTGSRAFSNRDEINQYLLLHQRQEQLDAEGYSDTLLEGLAAPPEQDWLSKRYHRLLFQLGHSAERSGATDIALTLYQQSNTADAKVRQLRVEERRVKEQLADPAGLYRKAGQYLKQFPQPELQLSFERIRQRCARKAGIDHPAQQYPILPIQTITLPQPAEGSVEQAVIEYLRQQGLAAHHIENQLFNGLFALLFWPVIFAPVKGAFFNPFQSGPVDLFRPEFTDLRQALIDKQLKTLDSNTYRELILQAYRDKLGISCSLIHWPSLTEALILQALELIPAAQLKAIFERLLLDLKNHKRGLPDLICFDHRNNRYKLIEVKGPGDRLQDHQRIWIEFLVQQGVDVEVWHIKWK